MPNLNCNVVKDLMPNYVDGLNREETNREVSVHLENCADCRTVYEQMKTPIIVDTSKDKRNINYLKKIKRKIWSSAAIAFGGILIMFTVFIWIFIFGIRANSNDVTYNTSIHTDRPVGAGEWKKGTIDLILELESDKALSVFPRQKKVITNKDGVITSQTVILTPRKVPEWIIRTSRYSYGISLSEDMEVTFVIRFSDKDITITSVDIRNNIINDRE